MAKTNADPNANLKNIPLSMIRESEVALRAVNKESGDYLGLVESVKAVGILNPINVREGYDEETEQKFYWLVDGLHRYNAAQDAGLETIPAQILSVSEAEAEERQLIANAHKVETKPAEYAAHLNRILANNPTMTQTQLAVKLAKSPTWLSQQLGLKNLDKTIAKMVDDNEIPLANAYVLAKLAPEEQENFVASAISMQPAEFTPTVQQRIKEIRDAKRQGRQPAAQEYVPVPHLRKMGEIKAELDHPTVGPQIIVSENLTRPADIWQAAIRWTMHMDAQSIEVGRQKFEQRKTEAEENKKKRAEERQRKKDEAAAAAARTVAAANA